MLGYRLVGGCLAGGVAVVLLFVAGRATAPQPAKPLPQPARPSPEQLTIAAATLVHGLEVQQDYSLAQSPDFVACRVRPKGGWFCDYNTTYVDEASAVWEITLDRANVPTLIRRVRSTPAPPSN